MLKRNLLQYLKRIDLKTALFLFLLLTSLYLFGDIVKDVLWEKEGFIDEAGFNFLDKFINPHLTKAMIVISLLGSAYFLLPAYVTLVAWLLVKKKKPVAFNTAIIGITSSVLVFVLKNVFHRTRPANPLNEPALNYSFPSGHTTTAFIFFGLLIHLVFNSSLQTKYKYVISAFLFLLSVLVGLSRVYLRKHFASDVIAGFCVGYAWLFVSLWVLQKFERRKTTQ